MQFFLYKKTVFCTIARFSGLLMIALVLSYGAQAFAKDHQGGGFSGPGPTLTSVAQAKNMNDDDKVTLRGNIIKSIGDEKYEFRDATGTMVVEIDDDLWRGQKVEPTDMVELRGEVDKTLTKFQKVEVFEILKQ